MSLRLRILMNSDGKCSKCGFDIARHPEVAAYWTNEHLPENPDPENPMPIDISAFYILCANCTVIKTTHREAGMIVDL